MTKNNNKLNSICFENDTLNKEILTVEKEKEEFLKEHGNLKQEITKVNNDKAEKLNKINRLEKEIKNYHLNQTNLNKTIEKMESKINILKEENDFYKNEFNSADELRSKLIESQTR